MLMRAALCPARIVLLLAAVSTALSAQTSSLRTTTQLVEIDTIATDSHGRPITDLKAEDFKLFEDGVARPLSHFSFEKVEPLDPKATQRLHDLAQNQKAGVYANFTADTAIVPPNGCTVLLIDWLNTPIELQPSALQELKKFIEMVNLSKPLAIYSLDTSLHLVQGYTMDRQVLKSNIEAYGRHTANLQPEKRQSHNLDSEMTDFRVSKSVTSLIKIAVALQGIQGHKSLLWLSGSFPAGLKPTNRLVPALERGASGWVVGDPRDYSGTIRQLSHLLSANNIAVYPVDAQGLQTTVTDISVGGKNNPPQLYLAPATQSVTQRQEAMREVADLTGGRAFYNHNDIGEELDSAYTDASSFYALAFAPAKNKPDGKIHSVRVECRRAGIHLRYRQSYYADDRKSLTQMDRAVLEQFVRTPGQAADGVPVMAQLDKKENDQLNLWLDGSALSMPSPQSPYLLVDIAVATFDNQGALLQHHYANMRVKLSPDKLQEVQAGGLSQTLQFVRTKETARVRVAVRDLASGRVGSLEIPLQ